MTKAPESDALDYINNLTGKINEAFEKLPDSPDKENLKRLTINMQQIAILNLANLHAFTRATIENLPNLLKDTLKEHAKVNVELISLLYPVIEETKT